MQLRILLFAAIRDAADSDVIDIVLDGSPSADQVIESVAANLSDVADLVRVSRLAIDGRYVGSDFVIESEPGEIALIPPVSGG